MRCTAFQLTILVLTVIAAIPGACENQGVGNNGAQDEVTLMQLHMTVASSHDTKKPVKVENAHAATDTIKNNQDPSNATDALLPNPEQHDSPSSMRALPATPEKFTHGEMQPQWQTLGSACMKLTSIMQKMQKPVVSMVQTPGSGAATVGCVLVPVATMIIVILMLPSQSASPKKDAGQRFEMRWYHYILFVSISMLGPMATDILLPAFPEISSSLRTTDYLTSLTMPVNMGVRSVTLVVIGLLSDRFGQKKMMMVSLFMFVGGSIICMTATDIQTLFAGRVVQGMGEGSDALVQAVVRMLIDDAHNRMQVLSVLTGLQPVFVVIAPLIGSILSHYFGWRAIFAFLVCPALGSLVGYALVVPETRDDSPRQPVSQQFVAVFGNQEVMFLLMPFALIFTVLLSMLCNMAFILDSFGESTIAKGLLMASLPPFVAVGATVTGKFFVSEDQSLFITLRRAMGVEGLLLLTMFFMGMVFVHSEWLIMASFWSITFGMGLCVPTLSTLYLEPLKNSCGLASGILVGAQNFSAALLVPFSVGALEAHGIRSMYVVFITIHLIAQAIFWVGFGINHEKWLKDKEDSDKASTKNVVGAATLLQNNAAPR